MNLAISNIAWFPAEDCSVFNLMKRYGFTGLEIAPTRIIPEAPYDKLDKAGEIALQIKSDNGFSIPSMQSILFNRTEQLFGDRYNRKSLFDYLKKAVDFAAALHCRNLVFGSPRNRIKGKSGNISDAIDFFKAIGAYAHKKGTCVSIEANPDIYGTDFLTHTSQTIDFVKQVASPGIKINFDFGTAIHNQESLTIEADNIDLFQHFHISEPYLVPVQHRSEHRLLADLLHQSCYRGFVSIEMKRPEANALEIIESVMAYVKSIFGRPV